MRWHELKRLTRRAGLFVIGLVGIAWIILLMLSAVCTVPVGDGYGFWDFWD